MDIIHCGHVLSQYEEYVLFEGKQYCPTCFGKLMENDMECIGNKSSVMGVSSGLFKYKPDGTKWRIIGDICAGPMNCGYVVHYSVTAEKGRK